MRRSIVLLLAVLASPVWAGPRVELAGEPWRRDALASALRADLAGEPAELVVRGELRAGVLAYVIERPHGAPVRGTIALAGLDRQKLAGIFKDRLHRVVRGAEVAPAPPAELAEPAHVGGALAALAVLAALLAVPIGYALRARGRALRLRGTRRLALAIAGVAGVAYAIVAHGARLPEASEWVFLAGGLAWGTLAVVALPLALPPLAGVQRVESGELGRVLLAWLAAAGARTLALAVVAAPLAVVVWLVGDALELPRAVGFGVAAPLLALALGLVWQAIVEQRALARDAELVAPDAKPWHAHVRGYLVGYLRRANLEVDEELLARMQFLPGRGPDVAIYGGGLVPTRVVIPEPMLEHALAPYGRPHDYAMPRVSTLHWTHWNAGLVMPTEPGAKLATRADRVPHDTVEEGEHERILLGEPPTLSGVIEPRAFDPRSSYRPTEDPLFLDWDPGEEYDGTDAGDKDYLFGLLVHALGVAQRREDRVAVFTQRLVRRGSALGDAAIALGGARHHHAQYLAWLAWKREELATARAYIPELEQTSHQIVAALDRSSAPLRGAARSGEAGPFDAKAPRGLVRLRPYLVSAAELPRRRRLVLAVGAALAVAAVATVVVQAVLYHGTYEARMKAERERLDDGKRN